MYCPKCGNKSENKQCEYCGAILEIDESYDLNPYEKGHESYDTDENYNTEPDTDEAFANNTDDTHNDGHRKKLIIITLCCIFAVIIALISALFLITGETDTPDADSAAAPVSASEELSQKGERYMDIGDYESAEAAYKELFELSGDDEAATIYKILYNYNRAVQMLDDYDYKAATKFFEKIPVEYMDYAIYDDVEILGEEITRFEAAYEIFESIESFIADGNYDAAKEAIEILDENVLSKEDKETLKSYKEEIANHEKKEIILSEHDAEDLLLGYCDSFVKAVNEKNFDIVAPYIHKDSAMYTQQKKLIESYIADGITESFDEFKLVSLTKASDTSWQARVSESETISYTNGEKQSKTYNWIYTIEYIDSAFYITNIK